MLPIMPEFQLLFIILIHNDCRFNGSNDSKIMHQSSQRFLIRTDEQSPCVGPHWMMWVS